MLMAVRVCKACILASLLSMIQLVCRQLAICMVLHSVVWSTCVVCWRAWFSVPPDFGFQETLRPGSASHQAGAPWFDSPSSVTLRATQKNRVNRWVMEFDKGQDVAAREYVRENFSPQYAPQSDIQIG